MINRTFLKLGAVLCFGFLVACTSTGNPSLRDETPTTLGQKIQNGVTRKSEVYSLLGVPRETTFTDSGQEVARYEFTRLTPRARNFIPYNVFSQVEDGVRKELTILFNNDGTVNKFVMNESDVESRWGLVE